MAAHYVPISCQTDLFLDHYFHQLQPPTTNRWQPAQWTPHPMEERNLPLPSKRVIPKAAPKTTQKAWKLNWRKAMANQETQRVIARLAVMLVAALVVCNLALGQDVKTDYMPGTDFTKFHTYKWVTIPGGQHPNQIVDEQIKQAVDTQLAKKGLTKTTEDTADLLVGYQVAVDQE